MTADILALLRRRRSVNPAALKGPGPSRSELETLLSIASRVPDHGKLAPWRFVVLEGAARERWGRLALDLKLAERPELDAVARDQELNRFSQAPVVVAVVSRAKEHVKIPQWEQVLSAGAACMNLVVAANAMGFATSWFTDWCAYDRRFAAAVGLEAFERFAGFIHIGRPAATPEDRARPELADVTTWLHE